ncbi:DUF3862 domain-containing protein [Bacillus sp. AFS055030]|uniref:DUF3862 domain-containing protein n=1 Tax=Bacillus sp. AFS055030 TaxID=2033507 RepID=UPI000BFE650E|nr:DUF3862 domain-containing protein [Bacillus sp. AFS055030]PGL73490.1 hypothetical protein CN925_00385 [Bacillus sp. AFS055030]
MKKTFRGIAIGTVIATGLIVTSGCSFMSTTESKEATGKSVIITKAEFEKIQNGMTTEEVFKIIGGKGEVMSEAGENGKPGYTILYTYSGKGSTGANANFTFQDGKLMAKAQVGLK